MHVLLTGATGTIGSALAPRLLELPRSRLSLLMRARDAEDLTRRFRVMLSYWNLDGANVAERLQPVLGDVSESRLGLNDRDHAELAQTVTHVVHSAASVKLNMPMSEALSTAVAPTREILGFARLAAEQGQLQKVDLISTVGVWGRSPGVMPEARLDSVKDFHNTYEAAKYQAEQLLFKEAGDLPFTLHRPSMVVGDSRTGLVVHYQVFYHLCEFLTGSRTFGVMPRLGEQRLDTVPVDWVASAILWAMQHPSAVGRVLHLCSGPDRSIGLMPLQALTRRLWHEHGRTVPGLKVVPSALLRAMVPVIGLFVGSKGRRALKGLPPVLAYLAEDQGFSNANTTRLLEAHSLPLPPPEAYLETVLKRYLDDRSART